MEIDKAEYQEMAIPVINGLLISTAVKQKPFYVELLLKKPDLLGNSKWEFIFNKTIQVKAKDTLYFTSRIRFR